MKILDSESRFIIRETWYKHTEMLIRGEASTMMVTLVSV